MFLFDTYALIEIITGNQNYKYYTKSDFIINKFILSELAYWLIKNYGAEALDSYTGRYEEYVKDAGIKVIKDAMVFRYENKKKKLSITDCVSYFQAKELGIKFLTGD